MTDVSIETETMMILLPMFPMMTTIMMKILMPSLGTLLLMVNVTKVMVTVRSMPKVTATLIATELNVEEYLIVKIKLTLW